PPRLAPPLFALSASKILGHGLRARQWCARPASQTAQPVRDPTGVLAASRTRTALHRKKPDFDGSARKRPAVGCGRVNGAPALLRRPPWPVEEPTGFFAACAT